MAYFEWICGIVGHSIHLIDSNLNQLTDHIMTYYSLKWIEIIRIQTKKNQKQKQNKK